MVNHNKHSKRIISKRDNLLKRIHGKKIDSISKDFYNDLKEREKNKGKLKKRKKKEKILKIKNSDKERKKKFEEEKKVEKQKEFERKKSEERLKLLEEKRNESIKNRELIIAKKIEEEFDKKKDEEEEKKVEKQKEFERKKSEEENSLENEKLKKEILYFAKDIEDLKREISKVVIGHEDVVDGIIKGFLANGHVLIEGVPGVAKTLLIKVLSKASGCDFSRIQFTVDLLPTDITGVTIYDEIKKEFSPVKGPIFANFIIADEINRAPPKSQSALLEAMQEGQVTIGKETHKLPNPFFVMANNNPIESSGTYSLPEAQIDRFLFKIKMIYTSTEDEEKIIDTNVTINKFEDFDIKPVLTPKKIIDMQEVTKKIIASSKIKKYIVKIVNATRNPKEYNIKLGKYIEWGCSPRASIGLTIAAKADALMRGSFYITPQNVKNIAHSVLRHRIILNYLGQAENINRDDIITEILNKVLLS